MSTDKRRAAATTTVGAAGVVTGAHLREAGIKHSMKTLGLQKRPWPPLKAVLKSPSKRGSRLYWTGMGLGAVTAPALATGFHQLTHKVDKRDERKPFLQEGLKGTGEVLHERAQNMAQPISGKARAAGLVGAGAVGGAGSLAAHRVLDQATKGPKYARLNHFRPGITATAGVLSAAAAVPLTSKLVQRAAGRQYEVAPGGGVRRKKIAAKRPSSKSTMHRATPRSFQADISKNADSRAYRAKVTAAGAVPVPGLNYVAQGKVAAHLAPEGRKGRAAGVQAGAGATGDVAGTLVGAHVGVKAAERFSAVRTHSERIHGGIEDAKAKLPHLPKHKFTVPAAAGQGKAGKAVRAAVRPFKGKYAPAAAVGAIAGQMTIGNAAQQAAITHNYKMTQKGRVAKADAVMSRKDQQKQLKRRSRLIAINTMGATTGAAGLTTFAASRHPHFAAHKPRLEAATLGLGAVGGGIGSYGGFKRARVELKDVRAQRKAMA